jgi:rare lipoprotein A
VVALVATLLGGSAVEAKIMGSTHCYRGTCHRVLTIPEVQASIGARTIVRSSYYDDCRVDRHNTCGLTSSGEIFKPHLPDNAASPIYPDGTKLLVWHPQTKVAAIVRVNSAGPYHSNRTLDVSRATADRLGFRRSGVATLHVQILSAPTAAEARYKKHRDYAAVPGPIGTFATLDLAAADSDHRLATPAATTQVAILSDPKPAAATAAAQLKTASAAAVTSRQALERHSAWASAVAAFSKPGQVGPMSTRADLIHPVRYSPAPALLTQAARRRS